MELSVEVSEGEGAGEVNHAPDQGSVVKQAQSCIVEQLKPTEIPSEYWRIFMANNKTHTIEFPIGEIRGDAPNEPQFW